MTGKYTDTTFDFVIIGSGFGGLCSGFILADEGYSVCIIEKNKQLGGNLQVFSRDKVIFDTGVHYIGSLDEGQLQHQFFKYFQLTDKLKMKRMDADGYDIIRFPDGKEYKYGMGYDNFIKILVTDFPEEKLAIRTFCDKIQEICRLFPLYNLEENISPEYINNTEFREINAEAYIASLTNNVRLQNVLAGSNPLYAGVKNKTPLYVHALILNSYIISSYKLVDGSSQLATLMARNIRQRGGELIKNRKVTGGVFDDEGLLTGVTLADGSMIKGKNFISNMHPAATIDIFGESRFLGAYRKRVKALENTISSFSMYISFKKDSFPYMNHNVYYYMVEDVWSGTHYTTEKWPEGFFICTPASSANESFAEGMSVMTYMRYEETEQWAQTFNTTSEVTSRGSDYEQFKKQKEELILVELEKLYPGIREKIVDVYSSTPLTFRDYIGNYDGSMYGILKDSNEPMRTFINPRTKIPNLYLTGQNLIFHGILGVTIGAFVTCFNFVDSKKIIDKVKNA